MTNVEALRILQAIQRRVLLLNQAFDLAELEKDPNMANGTVQPEVAELITGFDAATNKIAARIQNLIDNGSLNEASKAALQAEVTKLNALGEDPSNPLANQ